MIFLENTPNGVCLYWIYKASSNGISEIQNHLLEDLYQNYFEKYSLEFLTFFLNMTLGKVNSFNLLN